MKIVDRIVSALLSLAVIPVAIFTPMINWIYQIMGYELINSLLGGELSNPNDTGLTEDDMSLYWIYERLRNFGVDFEAMLQGGEVHSTVQPYMIFIKLTAVFFILALVIALASCIVSIVSNAKKTQMILGGCGIASLIGMMISFNNFASALVDGKFTIGALVDIPFLSYITKFESVTLSSAWVFMLMLFIGLILWSLSYILTSDNSAEKGKKI